MSVPRPPHGQRYHQRSRREQREVNPLGARLFYFVVQRSYLPLVFLGGQEAVEVGRPGVSREVVELRIKSSITRVGRDHDRLSLWFFSQVVAFSRGLDFADPGNAGSRARGGGYRHRGMIRLDHLLLLVLLRRRRRRRRESQKVFGRMLVLALPPRRRRVPAIRIDPSDGVNRRCAGTSSHRMMAPATAGTKKITIVRGDHHNIILWS
mmetsp:Transcript_53937/g.114594  ORF Transcript_53937/g.114594 Transcript_53937/m.114594 type:complete len:208 (+) Transcript_53937:449-1072(+)